VVASFAGCRTANGRVRDKVKNIGYEVDPGPEDFGVPDAWSGADIWALRYHGNELDDGGSSGGGVNHDAAHTNNWLNNENIDGQDVVLWYRVGRRHVGSSQCVGWFVLLAHRDNRMAEKITVQSGQRLKYASLSVPYAHASDKLAVVKFRLPDNRELLGFEDALIEKREPPN
jgi:Copper amine oxidase, enzyme domain